MSDSKVADDELFWSAKGDPKPGTLVEHIATGRWYRVLHVGRCAHNARRRVVVYQETADPSHVWVRELGEFTDGRFAGATKPAQEPPCEEMYGRNLSSSRVVDK